jgi:N-acetylmuramoyl-L-alanine amidase
VAGADVPEAPMPVGQLDILAPISTQLERLGASVTRVAPENMPGNPNAASDDNYFQINPPGGTPIVMMIGRRVAYINKAEQPLKAAPLVIKDKIWLPVFSVAPLLGAAPRLSPDGTLHINPTIQSVELFLVKGVPALTVKTSAPLPDGGPLNGGPQIGTLENPDRIYIDFPGYALGLDAANTPTLRVVAPGLAGVSQVRAGMFQQFPDTARLTLDLKKEMRHVVQTMPDRSIFALLVYDPNNPIAQPEETPPPGNLNVSLRGLTIVVDAGHGGHDIGAPGKQSVEKNHALDIALRLRKELDKRGATVLMTRDGDYFVSLQGRVDFANSRRADLFISCHIDAAPGSTATGSTTYYYSAISQPFAREVQNELAKASGLKSKGIIQRKLFVTRKTWMPSVLTESCYISNPREEKLLLDPNFRQRLANGMAQGIANYIARYGKPRR